MKKIAALIGAGALLLSVATPAFGAFTINKAKVKNVTIVKAETGDNVILGNGASAVNGSNATANGNNTVKTGDATAKNLGVVAANTNVGCCPEPCDTCENPCNSCQGSSLTINKAKVKNVTVVKADTGDNVIGGNTATAVNGSNATASGNNTVDTGNADAGNIGIVAVNTQVSLGW